MNRIAAILFLSLACFTAGAVYADQSTEQVQARLAAAQKKLDDLRDNAVADDYRTIQVRGSNGQVTFRRVPTEEFAARIERAEKERDDAQSALTNPRRSLY